MKITITHINIPITEKTDNTAGTSPYVWNSWDAKYHMSQIVPTTTPPRADVNEPH